MKTLTGTEKQIKWAESLRATRIEQAQELRGNLHLVIPAVSQIAEEGIAALYEMERSEDFISHRGMGIAEFVSCAFATAKLGKSVMRTEADMCFESDEWVALMSAVRSELECIPNRLSLIAQGETPNLKYAQRDWDDSTDEFGDILG